MRIFSFGTWTGATAGELPAGSRGGASLELAEVLARWPGLEPAPAAPPGGPSSLVFRPSESPVVLMRSVKTNTGLLLTRVTEPWYNRP